jgi:hypothetical protein
MRSASRRFRSGHVAIARIQCSDIARRFGLVTSTSALPSQDLGRVTEQASGVTRRRGLLAQIQTVKLAMSLHDHVRLIHGVSR